MVEIGEFLFSRKEICWFKSLAVHLTVFLSNEAKRIKFIVIRLAFVVFLPLSPPHSFLSLTSDEPEEAAKENL